MEAGREKSNKVARALRICTSDKGCGSCPYRGAHCAERMMQDALAVIESGSPQEPEVPNNRDKPVVMYAMDGEVVQRFRSADEAQRRTGVASTSISRVCTGRRKTAGGYVWRHEK